MSTVEASIPAEVAELSPYAPTRSTVSGKPLSARRASQRPKLTGAPAIISALGMIYLLENPLLTEPLRPEHIKNRLLGHWGSSPGLSFIYVHLNRLIKKYDLDMIFLAGPGHGAPGVLGPAYLEGTYSEIYPEKSQDPEGLREFFKRVLVSRAESAATARRKLQARFTKAENWVTFSPMRVARLSTILN